MQLKNAYDRLVNVTEDEWRTVEKFGLVEPLNKVISKFWEDIEYITTAFFDILELLNRKEYLEKSILGIWKSQLVQVKDKQEASHDEVLPSSDDGIAVVPGYLEYLNSQLVELKGRIKWVEYNLMKYKFAATHGPELKTVIDQVLKGSKKHSKWPRFSRSWRHQNRKLEGEVEWYRKRLKFFREDVQRIKSVHQAIFQKYLTPEDQKRFPSKTFTLEHRLKGNPTNYPGSWIETSRHSGLSTNLSGHSSTSAGNTVLPWTISMPGPSRSASPSASTGGQQTHCAESKARQEIKVELDGISQKMNDRIATGVARYNSDTSNVEGKFVIEANCSPNQQLPDVKLSSKVIIAHERCSIPEKFGSPDRLASSTSQCFGDGGRKFTARPPLAPNAVEGETQQFSVENSKMNVVNKTMDDRNPFLKDEASKTERIASTTRSNVSMNPFEGDDEAESVEESHSNAGAASECNKSEESTKPRNEKESPMEPSSESSYESAEEVLQNATGASLKAMSQQGVRQNITNNRITQCSSLTHLPSSVYLPCSLAIYAESSSAMRHVEAYNSSTSAPNTTQIPNYELLFLNESEKPQRNVLKKLFGKKK